MSSTAQPTVKTYQNYVNGQWVNGSSNETFPVFDPSTEEIIAQVASATAADVDKAVKAARAAFDSGPWAQTSAQDRGRVLFKLAEKIRQNTATLAEIEARNTGKPIVEAEYDEAFHKDGAIFPEKRRVWQTFYAMGEQFASGYQP